MAGPQAQRPISPPGLSEYAVVQSGLPARRSGLLARRSSHEGTSVSRAAQCLSAPRSSETCYAEQVTQTSSGIGTTNVSAGASNITTITTTTMPAAAPGITDGSGLAFVDSQKCQKKNEAAAAITAVEQHIEISVDDEQNRDKDVEHGGKKVRHRHHRRPLYRRVINYIRHAWTGVKFSSSNGK